jgi:hypothetical protein
MFMQIRADLVEQKIVQIHDVENELVADDEVESMAVGQAGNPGAVMVTQELAAMMDKLASAVRVLLVLVVGLGGLFVGYVMKSM